GAARKHSQLRDRSEGTDLRGVCIRVEQDKGLCTRRRHQETLLRVSESDESVLTGNAQTGTEAGGYLSEMWPDTRRRTLPISILRRSYDRRRQIHFVVPERRVQNASYQDVEENE